MHNSLMTVIAIVSTLMGFMLGYATAPMLETGMLTGQGGKPAAAVESAKDLEKYYRDLFKEK